MQNKPLVSVIMSTYNTNKEFLKLSIDSILNQSYENLELIIVIDGGNDDKYIKENYHDERIRIIKHTKNMGLPKSLNEAIKQSNGEFIARMDSDDISTNDRIEYQVKYMKNHDNVDIVSSWYKTIGASNKKVKEKNITNEFVRSKLFFINIVAHPSVMFRKSSIYNKNLFYDENFKYSQDFELWNRNKNLVIHIIPHICLYYRIHNKQISNSKKNEQEKFYIFTLERNLRRLDIEVDNVKYLLILNGKIKSINYDEVYEFIEKALNNNFVLKVYDIQAFDIVLHKQYIVYAIKNNKVFNKYFVKSLIKIFKR